DANGILNVSAKDKGTNKEQSIRIESSSGLSSDDVEQMQKDAEANAEVDKSRREAVDKRNAADQMVYATEKTLSEHGDKLSDEDRKPVEEALEVAKKALEGEDAAAIDAAVETLQTASHKLAEVVYTDAQAQAGTEGAEGSAPDAGAAQDGDGAQSDEKKDKNDKAVDADFEVV
ncbi:MAG: Hsp70 family protein, partial [Gemmatimonadetes bacterium]|nr:Hsp70 family protein [Gemmatimonadota bacterium]